jgi:hypothetical protein
MGVELDNLSEIHLYIQRDAHANYSSLLCGQHVAGEAG